MEQISNGTMLKRIVLFMANQWSEQKAIEIFGKVMGEHFWNKWTACLQHEQHLWNPDQATMRLFYEMSTNYLDTLTDYILENYK